MAGATIALVEMATGELRPNTLMARLRVFSVPWGILLMAGIVVPWHLLAGARNPEFLWDYVVNQHLLFFFDKKLPRDSIPDSLGVFWAGFFACSLPWSLFLPGAVVQVWIGARTARNDEATHLLPALWLATVLAFFSLAVSRFEHYSLPALPAMALLVGSLLADAVAGQAWVHRSWLVGPLTVASLLAFAITLYDPAALLVTLDPMLAGYGLETLVRPATLTLAVGLLGLALLLVGQYKMIAPRQRERRA